MNTSRLVDLLNDYTSGLIDPEFRFELTGLSPAEYAEIAPLLRLAERLHENMRPVQPRAAFVHMLKSDLIECDRDRLAGAKRVRRVLMIGAAVLGSVVSIASVVGAIILFATKRHERARTHAVQAPTA